MVPFGNELDSYLVHRILIIDRDREERNRLNGVLGDIRGIAPEASLDDASVNSLSKARDYIAQRTPSVIIIDPEVDPTSEVITFIADSVVTHPTIIWVINSQPHWWAKNEQSVRKHPFGERLSTYYRRTKSTEPNEAKRSFLVTLAQCQSDFVLQLLDKTATEIRTEIGKNMTDEQLRKFVTKAIRPLLSLLAKDHNRPQRSGRLAFVSMPFTDEHRLRYTLVIEPMLKNGGYEPRMMELEIRNQLIPVAILGDIAQSSLFIADITGHRPDVMIELGAAFMLKIPVILLAHHDSPEDVKVPFMVRNIRIECYASDADLQQKLKFAMLNPGVPFSRA